MTEFGEFREDEPNHHIEILRLYELQGRRRAFDATNGSLVIAGRASLDLGWKDGPRIYVITDRGQPLDCNYAVMFGGSMEDLADDQTFSALIVKALAHMPLPAGRTRYFNSTGTIDPQTN